MCMCTTHGIIHTDTYTITIIIINKCKYAYNIHRLFILEMVSTC